MLESLKSLFAGPAAGASAHADVAAWAKRRGMIWKRERETGGFAIEGALEQTPWRLEWGPPQRTYIEGRELRLRMVLGLPPDLQMLVLSKPLVERFEKDAFDDFTKTNQTQVDTAAPEEMRWLVVFPKIAGFHSKTLRQRFGGVSSLAHEGPAWLEGPLEHALERATGTLLRQEPPFVLMTLRGRIYLRMQLTSPDETDIAQALVLFETAGTAAIRVAKARGDEPPSFQSTMTSAWGTLPPVRK